MEAEAAASDSDIGLELPKWPAQLAGALCKPPASPAEVETIDPQEKSPKAVPYRSRTPWGEEVSGYMPLYLRGSKTGRRASDPSDGSPDTARGASPLRGDIEGDLPTTSSERLDWKKKHEAHIAAAKMIQRYYAREAGMLQVERDSVYGAALTMPQLARSAGWPMFLNSLAFRSYLFLIINYGIQGMLLSLLQKEENVMDLFSGEMYLCDYGAWIENCPGDPSCMGPGGTQVTPARMYNYQTWNMRRFVRDSLKIAFPEKADEIQEKVDPGEYGVESYWCRCLCCAIFMMSCMSELNLIYQLCKLLYNVPTKDDPWIELRGQDEKDAEEDNHRPTAYVSHMRIQVAGMPLVWKIINIMVILIPKALLWKITCEAGVMFLMETAGIEEIIINSVALAFILNIDEMMCQSLMSQVAKDILSELEDKPLYKLDAEEENLPDEEVMARHNRASKHRLLDLLYAATPWKLLCVLGLTVVFIAEYYMRNCTRSDTGRWVSKDMYLPLTTDFGFWTAFFPNIFHVPSHEKPFWSSRPDTELRVEE